MSEDYWDGAMWAYEADITNGAGGAGENSYLISPGAGNEMEIFNGVFFNGDSSPRIMTILMEGPSAEKLAMLLDLQVNAGTEHPLNTVDEAAQGDTFTSSGARMPIGGTMRLAMRVAAVAASQDTAFGCFARIRGGLPIVTEAGISTPTININLEQVF